MCGICGLIYNDVSKSVDPSMIGRMCDTITHRGPDDVGTWVEGNVGLGMRRLSIIDLVTGKQPISNEDDTTWIVFNGEIYNHDELRRQLQAKGHKFKTKTDTEAILHAYEEYGEDCPAKLNGMFAFAIWDQKLKKLFIARDRIGIKPLYYFYDHERFIFGSEIKAILQTEEIPRRIDLQALDNFLTFEYIPAPLSILQDVKKLMPGHSISLSNRQLKIKKYWEVEFNLNEASEAEFKYRIRELLSDAVKIRLMSDVPLGAFLSGGIDSSTIVALMSQVMKQPVKTFSIGFEDSTYNELDYARLIARTFKTDHHEFIIKPNAVELTENLIYFLDEPFGDFSIFPTYLVSKMAREYVTVVLSGDGGDELFAGYDTYIADRYYRKYSMIPASIRSKFIPGILDRVPPSSQKKGIINKIKRFVEGSTLPEDLRHVRWMIFLLEQEKSKLYNNDMKYGILEKDPYKFIRTYFANIDYLKHDATSQQLYVDIKTYLVDDILVKVDRMSMATSLEARVPFLDYRFVELAASIPSNMKLRHHQTKYILKKAMDDILPHDILYRGKQGFSIPIKNWLRQDLKPMMTDVLATEKISREGFFDPSYVEQLKTEHLKGIKNHSHRLWALMMFGMWFDLYMR